MPDNALPVMVRHARGADKDRVLAFCEHTFEWGDYLHLAWDGWLADQAGPLLVATLDEEPVGVAKVTLVTPSEAWLQGLRIHPAYRRHGLAWQLQSHCLNVARELGASVARLATSAKNAPVHKMSERAGMRRVVEVVVLEASAVPPVDDAVPLIALTMEDWPQVSRRILDGATLTAMAGLYEADWAWHALTCDKLRAHLARAQVLAVCDEDGETAGVAIISDVDTDDHVLPVGHVDGREAALAKLALGLRQRAAALQAAKVEAVLPAGSPVLQAFVQAGYEPEDEDGTAFYIYELDLKGAVL